MASNTNTNKPTMADLLEQVAALHRKVDELLSAKKAPSGSGAKKAQGEKEAKPRAPNSWSLFVKRVSEVLKANDLPSTGLLNFCSHLKGLHEAYGDLKEAQILEAHASFEPPEPKPKAKKPKAEEGEEGEAKPKRTLTQAQKDAMAEGRRKAAAKRKAEKEAEALAASGAEESEAEAEVEAPKPKVVEALKPFPFKGKRYLINSETQGLWLMEKDGSKGAWAGRLSEDKKTIDKDAKE